MDISIVGASGDCGREIAVQIVRERLMHQREILQLVGCNPASSRPNVLHGLRADLQDAYAEIVPEIDVTEDPSAVIGDIVVMAGGVTIPTDPDRYDSAARERLASANYAVFERFAAAIAAASGRQPPVVIVVSNPVELAVHVFARHFPRSHVVGMGAYSDSLRFRWEIAHDLGVRRQLVRGYVVGEHGPAMVPLWSSVRVHGVLDEERPAMLDRLRRGIGDADFPAALDEERARLMRMMRDDPALGPQRALRHIATLPPDLRVALKPTVIHATGSKTIEATATATVEMVRRITEGRPMQTAAQVQHAGENGLDVPFGSPVLIDGAVSRILTIDDASPAEAVLMARAAAAIAAKVAVWSALAPAKGAA